MTVRLCYWWLHCLSLCLVYFTLAICARLEDVGRSKSSCSPSEFPLDRKKKGIVTLNNDQSRAGDQWCHVISHCHRCKSVQNTFLISNESFFGNVYILATGQAGSGVTLTHLHKCFILDFSPIPPPNTPWWHQVMLSIMCMTKWLSLLPSLNNTSK